MHAVITMWSAPHVRSMAQHCTLRAQLIPAAQDLPGFVAGYSTLVPNGGTAYEFTIFDSESAAKAFMRLVGQDQPAQVEYGVQRTQVTLVEVVAVDAAE
jgi:hypothetical protein